MSLAAASGGLTQTIISGLVQIYKRDETFNTNEIANGMLACLVAVTGCCPFIGNGFSILIGGKTHRLLGVAQLRTHTLHKCTVKNTHCTHTFIFI